jgi:Family of unknown function (DUF5681)
MSLRQKGGEVGYKRPPKRTQWKKGQCGNPKRQYKRVPKGTVEIIDALFADQIDIAENGVSRRVSVFEAIILQLWIKEMTGNKRAIAVRLKYQEFVTSQVKPGGVIFEHPQDDYTNWLAEGLQRDGTKDE